MRRLTTALIALCCCSTGLGIGQLENPDLFEPVLDYDILPGLESVPDRERRFLAGLVIEAGRHTLFPELYLEPEVSDDIPHSATPKAESNPYDALSSDPQPGPIRFYETSGQPELEQSFLNRVNRRGECPEECHLYKPVCGTDGKVYTSECHLRKENCGSRHTVSAGPWSRCHDKHYLCPSRCLDISDPVCASDGRIYHNVCVMRKNNCGKLLQVLPLKNCYGDMKQWKREDSCPDQCPEIPEPACGSDGVIYFNDCFMKMQTCRTGIVGVSMDNCARVARCPEVCLPMYDPVCGSDGQLYVNQCRMLQHNCGKDIKKMPESFCSSVEQGKNLP